MNVLNELIIWITIIIVIFGFVAISLVVWILIKRRDESYSERLRLELAKKETMEHIIKIGDLTTPEKFQKTLESMNIFREYEKQLIERQIKSIEQRLAYLESSFRRKNG